MKTVRMMFVAGGIILPRLICLSLNIILVSHNVGATNCSCMSNYEKWEVCVIGFVLYGMSWIIDGCGLCKLAARLECEPSEVPFQQRGT